MTLGRASPRNVNPAATMAPAAKPPITKRRRCGGFLRPTRIPADPKDEDAEAPQRVQERRPDTDAVNQDVDGELRGVAHGVGRGGRDTLTPFETGDLCMEVAVGIGLHRGQVGPAFTGAARVGIGDEELDQAAGTGGTCEQVTRGSGQFRRGSDVHAAAGPDPRAAIVKDAVPADGVAEGGPPQAIAHQIDAVVPVLRDRIPQDGGAGCLRYRTDSPTEPLPRMRSPSPGLRPADRETRPEIHHADLGIGDGDAAADIAADLIAQMRVPWQSPAAKMPALLPEIRFPSPGPEPPIRLSVAAHG